MFRQRQPGPAWGLAGPGEPTLRIATPWALHCAALPAGHTPAVRTGEMCRVKGETSGKAASTARLVRARRSDLPFRLYLPHQLEKRSDLVARTHRIAGCGGGYEAHCDE